MRVACWLPYQALALFQRISPTYLGAAPDLAFQLQLARFHACAAAGDTAAAVQISRTCLAPIAAQHPHLEPLL